VYLKCLVKLEESVPTPIHTPKFSRYTRYTPTFALVIVMINGQCCLQIPIEHKLYNSLDLTTEALLKIIYIYIYIYIYIHIHTYIHTYIHAFQQHTHIYIYTHTHTHIHTYTQPKGRKMSSFSSSALQPLVCLGLLDNFTPQISISCFLPSRFHFRVLRSFNTESSHLNSSLPFFLLPSGLEKVTFLQGTLSYILANCPNRKMPTTTSDETFLQDMREPNRPQKQPITSLTPDQPSVS
jgi:hypothetical protein